MFLNKVPVNLTILKHTMQFELSFMMPVKITSQLLIVEPQSILLQSALYTHNLADYRVSWMQSA